MQTRRYRLFATLTALLVLLGVLAGCAPAAAPAPAASEGEAAAPAAEEAMSGDAVTLTIATVNNSDMLVMESFTEEFEAAYPNIELEWVVLPENELRGRVTTDTATGAGSFDVVTVGTFEVPIWGANGWIASVDELMAANPDNVQADYDMDDLLP
ncbi:MAG: extracellular solute-binding protein, partial [Caldilineaceae bacterium]|nr:extracellular solute-binding protein [Caldilineaceae bacterium]